MAKRWSWRRQRTESRTADELDGQAAADLAAAAAVGARLIGAGDAEWPEAALLSLVLATGRGVKHAAPPVALYIRGGSLAELPQRGVSVVGSRANTAYGQRVAADIAMGAAEAGLTVVSGAAFGIDTVAHRAALAYPRLLPALPWLIAEYGFDAVALGPGRRCWSCTISPVGGAAPGAAFARPTRMTALNCG